LRTDADSATQDALHEDLDSCKSRLLRIDHDEALRRRRDDAFGFLSADAPSPQPSGLSLKIAFPLCSE
jgi:hypothetical protein